ncbi:tRNA uridine-5-carboxymethylaminomethyl(34) synthesis enzyme MnmG [Candidatus Hakubella thermalkaliphila]|uniref:tRNA uridine 5-carboxymethylaminomethyl modification enzyme MnmG n=2 Tax=Candidatus Hakubella thermalkaliphila TaxID=2754717 RepID=A0A6V8Q7B9_9ACTN|nr:tRNA uridine-5-carboxymethylaminomethyl(34) synthesis enzyme MnmG [Candidatus Hakubella thermalkaliphila]GFP30608.1 tRNA uridine 5-carboxymethylaminomethyl modification enzyme [Candidatus Hakubella thermalkaliphila]GFP38801.1 tRNA uridine 5-carboxymethylaminomethyl modification enzyme [Candidatus Hakubella thermalkaliphila]
MSKNSPGYEVIVIGAGHAGCEAALASARMGCQTLLLTINLDKIALMPCNPAVGGIGKGQLVREVDALGGEMANNTDKSLIQIKVLNSSKGPAVQALRAQTDKKRYESEMKKVVLGQPNLSLRQGIATDILATPEGVQGIVTLTGERYLSRAVVVATGTFLNGRIVIGEVEFPAGRMGEYPAIHLSESLRRLGFTLSRFQSATPPRVDRRSIDFSRLIPQPGDDIPLSFSTRNPKKVHDQIPCYLTYTNARTHRVVRENIHRSPIKTGAIQTHGPRYCPSIDRKVINFPDKERHPVFIEPEGRDTQEMYLQGLTTSMPVEIQEKIVQATPGLEGARIMRPGYAIEYDYFIPAQLKISLETKEVRGLFTAGQINGTSGYEEAAAQGLIAGINAARYARGEDPIVLDRSQAYIGVLIDDLVTKSLDEPYRMFTSRAEYRLLLRSDNADLRLSTTGRQIGLISDETLDKVERKRKEIEINQQRLREARVLPTEDTNSFLVSINSSPISSPLSLADLLKRPEVSINFVKDRLCPWVRELTEDILEQIEIGIKYEGYIQRQLGQIRQYQRMEDRKLPQDIDYLSLDGITTEAREKLARIRPHSLGQASRIAGISPADLSTLTIFLQRRQRAES